MALKHISQLCNVGCQELTEQRHSGSNPDYGLPTPTLVSPPKVSCDWRIPGHVTAVLTSDWSRATRTLPAASWAASLPPTWRSRCWSSTPSTLPCSAWRWWPRRRGRSTTASSSRGRRRKLLHFADPKQVSCVCLFAQRVSTQTRPRAILLFTVYPSDLPLIVVFLNFNIDTYDYTSIRLSHLTNIWSIKDLNQPGTVFSEIHSHLPFTNKSWIKSQSSSAFPKVSMSKLRNPTDSSLFQSRPSSATCYNTTPSRDTGSLGPLTKHSRFVCLWIFVEETIKLSIIDTHAHQFIFHLIDDHVGSRH